MTDDSHLVEGLQRLGFSEKAASVYLAAVDLGRAKPATIAADADVSTSYVYQVCSDLEEDDLVTVDDHKSPTVVRATPPTEALQARVRQLTETVEELDRRYERPADDFETLEIVQSRPTLYRRIRRFVETADSEVFLAVPESALDELADVLRNAVDRGVLVLLAVSGTDRTALDGRYGDAATVVRSFAKGDTIYVCADQARGVIAPAAVLGWEHGDDNAIAFRNFSVAVAVESAFLGNVWPASNTVAVRRPTPLPTEYGQRFRHAVYDAELHRRAGRSVEATLAVRPTETTDPSSDVTGTVVDVRQSFVDPSNTDFGMENALYVDTGDRTVSVGAVGAFLEDYEATNVGLRPVRQ